MKKFLGVFVALFLFHTTPALAAYTCSVSKATGAPLTGRVYSPTTNTSAGINAAIGQARASGGGSVHLAGSVYTLSSPIVMKSNVELLGTTGTVLRAGNTFLQSSMFGGHPLVTTAGANNVSVRKLTVDGNGVNLNWNVPGRLSAYTVEARNSTNVIFGTVSVINPGTYSIVTVSSSRVCVRYSHTTTPPTCGKYDQLDGIHILQSNYFDVVNNVVRQNNGCDGDDALVAHTIGAGVSHGLYGGNDVSGGRHGSDFQFAFSCCTISDIEVAGNYMHNGPGAMHTGYYGGSGNLTRVTIHDNRFVDNGGGINIGNATYTTITNNQLCRSGSISLNNGTGNSVSGTTGC